MARKKEHEKEANAERWLLTYADLITLLLIFFVIMYAMSSINVAKFTQMSHAFSVSFGGANKSILEMSNDGILPDWMVMRKVRDEKEKAKLYVKMVSNLQKEMGEKAVRVYEDERGIVVSLASDFYFSSGSTEVGDSTRAILRKLFSILQSEKASIRFEGHTDDRKIAQRSNLAERLPTNWELSSQRAVNVLKYFESLGCDRNRLCAAAYADTKPIKPNATEAGRALNRRVDIILLTGEGAKAP